LPDLGANTQEKKWKIIDLAEAHGNIENIIKYNTVQCSTPKFTPHHAVS